MINTFARPRYAAPFFQFSAPPMRLQDHADARSIFPPIMFIRKAFVRQVNAFNRPRSFSIEYMRLSFSLPCSRECISEQQDHDMNNADRVRERADKDRQGKAPFVARCVDRLRKRLPCRSEERISREIICEVQAMLRKRKSRQMMPAGLEFMVYTGRECWYSMNAYTSTPWGVAKVPPRRAFMSSNTRSVPKAPGSYFRSFSFSRAVSMSFRASSSILPGSSSK